MSVPFRSPRAVAAALATTSTALLLGLAVLAPAATAAPTTPVLPLATTAATTTATVVPTVEPAATPAATTLVVQPGDTLTGIARAAGVDGGWPALYAANREAVGASPDRLLPGTVLVLPAAAAATTTYVVQSGDTLRAIAQRAGVEGGWPALADANRAAIGDDPDLLRVGVELVLPAAAAPAAPVEPPAATDPGAAPASPPTAQAPTQAPTAPAGTSGEDAVDDRSASGVPEWVLWPLLVVAVLGLAALVGDPLLAVVRRARRTRQQRVGVVAGSAAAPALRLVTAAPQSAPEASTRVHLEEHPALMVSYCPRDDLVLVLAPHGQDAEAVLDIARVVLPEAAYRAVERQLPARLDLHARRSRDVRAAG